MTNQTSDTPLLKLSMTSDLTWITSILKSRLLKSVRRFGPSEAMIMLLESVTGNGSFPRTFYSENLAFLSTMIVSLDASILNLGIQFRWTCS